MLIRSAHSANIKERRDCSTALFDAGGELVMQAEHIPVHLGSMPDAVAAVLDERAAPGRPLDPQRPLPRRHPPARHHPDLAALRAARRADRLRRQPRPPRRRRRPDARRDAGRLDPPRRGGRRDPADPRRRRRRCAELAARMRNPRQRLADLRAQRAANLAGERRLAELVERLGAERPARRDGRDPRLRRAPHAGGARRARRRRLRGRRTCSRAAPTAASDLDAAGAGDDRRRRAAARLRRHRRPGRGQPQLPAVGDQVGGLLRRPRAHRPRRAALGRRPPAGRGRSRPQGCLLNARPPAAVAAGNVETSSRVADLVIAALAGADAGAGAGPGDDEQPHPRRARAGPTTRRSAAARAPARTPTGRARSTSRCRTRSTPRSRRSRPSTRCACASCALRRGSRRRRARSRGGDGIVREIEALEPMRFTLITERRRHAAARARRRRATARRAATCSTATSCPSKCDGELRAGRPAADRDARGRRSRRYRGVRQVAGLVTCGHKSWHFERGFV